MNDPVDDLINEVARRHLDDEPYHVTAAAVFYDAIDDLDLATIEAL